MMLLIQNIRIDCRAACLAILYGTPTRIGRVSAQSKHACAIRHLDSPVQAGEAVQAEREGEHHLKTRVLWFF
jgi:hypothetical protein